MDCRHSFWWLSRDDIDAEDSTMRLGTACSNLLWQLITAHLTEKGEEVSQRGKKGMTNTPATMTLEHNPKCNELNNNSSSG